MGYSAANTPEAETVSNDCTFTRTGANAYSITCVSAGGGTGPFQAGAVCVGATGVACSNAGFYPAGTIASELGAEFGPVSAVNSGGPASGFVLADNTFETMTNNVYSLIGTDNLGNPTNIVKMDSSGTIHFGDDTHSILFDAANGTTFDVGGALIANSSSVSFQFQLNLGSAVELKNGAVLSMTGGTRPTLTAGCNGAGSSVAVGSTDNRGKFTTQTAAATTCTLTFNHTYPQSPFCVAVDGSATTSPVAISVGATSATTAVFDFASMTSRAINYMCE